VFRVRASTFLLVVFVALIPRTGLATTISFTGTFAADDDVLLFSLTVPTAGTVRVQTWSYAGGTNGQGQVITPGGFAPELTLFDSTGSLIAIDNVGGTAPLACGARHIDPSSGFCEDAFISLFLNPGSYTIVLTQQGNNPLGLLGDGFSQTGSPSFTGDNAGMPGSMFIDPGNFSQRNNRWALDITSPSALQPVPEPASLVLLLTGCAAGAPRARRRWLALRKRSR
jgi:hypothetical protein